MEYEKFKDYKLPIDWIFVSLKDIGAIVSGGTPSTKIPEFWNGEIPWITPADLSGYNEKYISRGKKNITFLGLQKSSAKLLPEGSILFSSRAPIGYVVIAKNKLATNQGFKNIIPFKYIISEYVYYYLKNSKKLAEDFASGTTFKEISAKNFARLPIPLPPLPEQRAIVARIEELFSRLDKGIETLQKVKEQLKVYRQAVLKWAFEGKLTAEWREQQKAKGTLPTAEDLLAQIKAERERQYQHKLAEWQKAVEEWEAKGKQGRKPAKPKKFRELAPLTAEELEKLPELPTGWRWLKFIEFCELQRGYDLPLKNVKEGPYPVITSGGLAAYHNDYKANGPCLVTGRSGGVGNIHFFEVEKYWPHNTVLFVKDFHGNFPKYMYYFFIQFNFKRYSASTAVPTLDRKMLYNVLVKVPPLLEQKTIVQEIETRLSVADKLEQIIDETLQKTEALRQSILKKAFEGKLLSEAEREALKNDPEWEPAEKLLERIKAEKERLEKENNRKRKHKIAQEG